MTRDLPTVVMSIETATRELDSKLALAAALADKGCRVVVAHKETAKEIARASRRVVWIGKSVHTWAPGETFLAEELERRESALIFHHDEGGIYPERDWIPLLLRSHPPELFSLGIHARICTWGAKQARVLQERLPGLEHSIAVTGSPRFDVCRPEYAFIEGSYDPSIRNCQIPYILVNTRFPNVMHSRGPAHGFGEAANPTAWPAWMTPDEIRERWYATWRQDARDMASLLVLIKDLALAHPGHTIVVRPHPSEDLEFYRTALSALRNVTVTREGSVVFWIRAADLVVHCKCTTGVEAVFAGRPVVHFWVDRDQDEGQGEEVAREAGSLATSSRDALDRAGALLGGERPPQVWSDTAREVLSNLVTPAIPLLVEETLKVIEEEGITSSDFRLPPESRRIHPLRYLRQRLSPTREGYVESKRGRIDPRRVEALIEGGRCLAPGAAVRNATERYVVVEPV